jgi:hypothetical protein
MLYIRVFQIVDYDQSRNQFSSWHSTFFLTKEKKRIGRVAQVVEHLPSKSKTMSSKPSTTKNQTKSNQPKQTNKQTSK